MNLSVAFKEWSQVCEALGTGRQSIILRKGGIREGRAGFAFEHDQFVLFPTLFHEQSERVRAERSPGAQKPGKPDYQPGDEIKIKYWAQLDLIWTLTLWDTVSLLEPFHIWSSATIRERFDWAQSTGDPPAIRAALVRIYKLGKPRAINYRREYGGCRSWLNLPPVSQAARNDSRPVLNDDAFADVRQHLKKIVGSPH
ncbi:MAG: DUF1802 family protein [Verrucomicrobiales bacterium]